MLALIVHVGLFALLFVGVRWQKAPPQVAQAELWIPQPDEPPPPPAPEPPR